MHDNLITVQQNIKQQTQIFENGGSFLWFGTEKERGGGCEYNQPTLTYVVDLYSTPSDQSELSIVGWASYMVWSSY